MPQPAPQRSLADSSRRDFLRASGRLVAGATVVGALGPAPLVHAAGSDLLKVGLIGCGRRGSGAVSNVLAADPQVTLTAMADVFADRLAASLETLQTSAGERAQAIQVPKDRQFVGFDAYKQLLATDVDVVLLTTPPHFRPKHFQAAIEAGKHVFAEKPVAVDAPGVRSVLATAEEARRKNLAVVSGLCYRYNQPKRELIARVHDGAIGDIRAMHVSYNTGTLWSYPRQPGWSDLEFQLRNWLYYTWLSGDFNVEQHVHSLDKAAWAMRDEPPLQAYGLGGRQVRTDPLFGNVYDHMAVVYEYAGGTRLLANCRQMAGCSTDVSDYLFGTKGTAELMKAEITGENPWRYQGPKSTSMYQVEQKELFASIRAGNPINNGVYMAHSTMLGIMGRMVCYTGQTLTWDECLASKEDLTPASYDWNQAPQVAVAVPGVTQFD